MTGLLHKDASVLLLRGIGDINSCILLNSTTQEAADVTGKYLLLFSPAGHAYLKDQTGASKAVWAKDLFTHRACVVAEGGVYIQRQARPSLG